MLSSTSPRLSRGQILLESRTHKLKLRCQTLNCQRAAACQAIGIRRLSSPRFTEAFHQKNAEGEPFQSHFESHFSGRFGNGTLIAFDWPLAKTGCSDPISARGTL